MMVGLPRAGKSTVARHYGYPRVSPDAIRLALHGHRYISEAEPMVWAMAKLMVRALFQASHHIVILDATNTTRARRDEWRTHEWRRRFLIVDTPFDVCIQRALAENDTEIVPVIERMERWYEPVQPDELGPLENAIHVGRVSG